MGSLGNKFLDLKAHTERAERATWIVVLKRSSQLFLHCKFCSSQIDTPAESEDQLKCQELQVSISLKQKIIVVGRVSRACKRLSVHKLQT